MRTRYWLALLTVAAAAVRFSTLGVQSFWSDEGFTVLIVKHSFGGILGAVKRTESTPPLYYYLGWLWHLVFGAREVGLRSLSALLGTATVPVSFAAASELFSRRVGLLCSALVAFSPLLVWYSQEARAYALLAFLLTLGLWLFARAVHGDRRAVWWWGTVSALALATHYFAVFTVVPEAAWLIFKAGGDRRVWSAAAVPAVMGVILVPLLIYQDHHVARPWTVGYTVKDGVTGVAQEALVGPTWTPLIHRVGVAMLAVLVLGAVVLFARDRAHRKQGILPAALLVILIGVPVAGAVVATNYLVIRNVIFAVPLVFVLVAAGCAYAGRTEVGIAVIGAICAIGLAIVIAVPLTPSLQRADWRGAIKHLASRAGPRVWVFLDRFQSTPVSTVYLPDARPLGSAPTTAEEVDIIGTIGYPGTATATPAPGFTLVERRVFGGLSISRFRAARPTAVTSAEFRQFDARVVATG